MSLQRGIFAGLTASLALVFIVQCAVAYMAVGDLMESLVARELVEDTEELFEALVLAEAGSQAPPSMRHVDPPFNRVGSERYFQILVDGRPVLQSKSLAGADLNATALAPPQTQLGRMAGPGGQPILFGSKGFEKAGHQVTIEIGMGLSQVSAHVRQVLWRFALVSFVMMALLLALVHLTVRRQLAVLRHVGQQVQRMAAGESRSLDEDVPAEVLPLVLEVNKLSTALTTRLQRSRRALGNLAHALKTPLSLLMQDAGRRHGGHAGDLSMQDPLEVIRGRIDLELKRARVAGPGGSDTAFEFGKDVDQLVDAMRKLHPGRNLHLSTQVPEGLHLLVDREDILELLGNLVDNACKFARRHVQVVVSCDQALELRVEDDGPGCDALVLARLGTRGTRADEAAEGHGLGLAIAADVAASYDGRLELGRSGALGGFSAKVMLPLGCARMPGRVGG